MKKLMIAVAIVCAAALSQAATSNWRWSDGGNSTLYTFADSTEALSSGMIYIFAEGKQSDVFAQWKTDGTMASDYLDSKEVSNGHIEAASSEAKEFSYGDNANKYSFFTALIDDDGNLFISYKTTATKGAATDLGTAVTTSLSKSTTHIADNSKYSSAGWYAAVPEPTSGLLLLLGVAGLALRRRRA